MIRNLNRNIILGLDWLQENGTRIYYHLVASLINDTYVTLEEYFLIGNIARITFDTILKSQTVNLCLIRIIRERRNVRE